MVWRGGCAWCGGAAVHGVEGWGCVLWRGSSAWCGGAVVRGVEGRLCRVWRGGCAWCGGAAVHGVKRAGHGGWGSARAANERRFPRLGVEAWICDNLVVASQAANRCAVWHILRPAGWCTLTLCGLAHLALSAVLHVDAARVSASCVQHGGAR
eukprot:353203-Chlamydomonas_euryale.AAC.4